MEIKKVMKNTYVAFLRYEILKAQLTYKCGRVVPFCTSVYFAISKLVLLFSYSLHVLCVILSKVYFYILHSTFPFLFNPSQSKAGVINQISFRSSKKFFLLFSTFWKWSYSQPWFDVDQSCEARRWKWQHFFYVV